MDQALAAPDYLNPVVPQGLRRITARPVRATNETLRGFGCLVPDPATQPIQITRWPAQGWRPVDPDSGDEGGTTEGVFACDWQGNVLYGRNEAVGGHYLLGWAAEPGSSAAGIPAEGPEQVLIWHANYHPDGGQLFFPLDGKPFVVPLALPGDDVTPEDFVAFWFDGSCGLYIHPNIWHEGVFPRGPARFFDKQGRVHARVSIDFTREYNCLLRVPLTEPA